MKKEHGKRRSPLRDRWDVLPVETISERTGLTVEEIQQVAADPE